MQVHFAGGTYGHKEAADSVTTGACGRHLAKCDAAGHLPSDVASDAACQVACSAAAMWGGATRRAHGSGTCLPAKDGPQGVP